jgi:hypothetical protein
MTRVISPEEAQIVEAFGNEVLNTGVSGRGHIRLTKTSILVALHYARQLKAFGKYSYTAAIRDVDVIGATASTVGKWAIEIENLEKVDFDLGPVYNALDAAHDARERASCEEAAAAAGLASADDALVPREGLEQQPSQMDVDPAESAPGPTVADEPLHEIQIDPEFLKLARELCERAGRTDAQDALIIGALRRHARTDGSQHAYAYPDATLRLLEALDVDTSDCVALLDAYGLTLGTGGVMHARPQPEAEAEGSLEPDAIGRPAGGGAEHRASDSHAALPAGKRRQQSAPAGARGKKGAKAKNGPGKAKKLKLLLDAGIIQSGALTARPLAASARLASRPDQPASPCARACARVRAFGLSAGGAGNDMQLDFRIGGMQVKARGKLSDEGAIVDADDGSQHSSPSAWAQHRIELAGLEPGTKTNGMMAVWYKGQRIKTIWEQYESHHAALGIDV